MSYFLKCQSQHWNSNATVWYELAIQMAESVNVRPSTPPHTSLKLEVVSAIMFLARSRSRISEVRC